ncbi:MAG: FGGY family carbohydrate kinase [Lentisphaeria bacterium]|jgi:xylulokinase
MGLFLGIDVSTQSVKGVVIDTVSGRIAGEASVSFGRDLPQYSSPNGFIPNADPLVKQADPMMWLDGLELMFKLLASSGTSLSEITGISGSGQQHGSIYLKGGIPALDSEKSLSGQLTPLLSRMSAPIWMDRSTSAECRELEAAFGDRMQRDTGSPAVERFTGPQIRKFAKDSPLAYSETKHIHLVSSFMCSVLIGGNAPVDYGDGAGMNLLNLKALKWDGEIVAFTAPNLLEKLPSAVPSNTVAGGLDKYFSKFGFRPGIPVVIWSGDNPNSLIGVGASDPGIACISLGTSDTFFAPMQRFTTDPEGCGHVFGNPAGGFMSLICFTNGSLARERVRLMHDSSWDFFDSEACRITAPFNDGRLILPYFEPESTPLVLSPGARYNYDSTSATPAQNIRAIMESQALSLRVHSKWQNSDVTRIRLTGGGSQSRGFRQILADVFQADIESIAVTNSAGLGAAMRAANAVESVPFETLAGQFSATEDRTAPNRSLKTGYDRMLEEYSRFEKSVTKSGNRD